MNEVSLVSLELIKNPRFTLEFRLSAGFSENLFNVLLPFRDAWREGHIDTQSRFASRPLLERAFSELLFCKTLVVTGDGLEGQLYQCFLSLPAVRECTSLRILAIPLNVAEVVEWLNVHARSKEPKRLEMYDTSLRDSVDNLVQQLKTVPANPF